MHSSLGFWSVYSVTSIVLKATALTNHKTKSRLLTWLKHQPKTWTIFAGGTRMWIHPSGTCSRCTTKTAVLYSLCDNTTLPQYKSMRFCKTLTLGAFRKECPDQRCTQRWTGLQAMLAAPVAMKSGSAHTHTPNSHGNHGYPQVYVGKPGLMTWLDGAQMDKTTNNRYQQIGKKLLLVLMYTRVSHGKWWKMKRLMLCLL